MKLKYRGKLNKPEVTDELRKKITREDFVSLLQHIDSEFIEFYSVFDSFRWDPPQGLSYYTEDDTYYAKMHFHKDFKYASSSKASIIIALTIQQFLYKLKVIEENNAGELNVLLEKELWYSEVITDKDKSDIVNTIGNYLNQYLERQGLPF